MGRHGLCENALFFVDGFQNFFCGHNRFQYVVEIVVVGAPLKKFVRNHLSFWNQLKLSMLTHPLSFRATVFDGMEVSCHCHSDLLLQSRLLQDAIARALLKKVGAPGGT